MGSGKSIIKIAIDGETEEEYMHGNCSEISHKIGWSKLIWMIYLYILMSWKKTNRIYADIHKNKQSNYHWNPTTILTYKPSAQVRIFGNLNLWETYSKHNWLILYSKTYRDLNFDTYVYYTSFRIPSVSVMYLFFNLSQLKTCYL